MIWAVSSGPVLETSMYVISEIYLLENMFAILSRNVQNKKLRVNV